MNQAIMAFIFFLPPTFALASDLETLLTHIEDEGIVMNESMDTEEQSPAGLQKFPEHPVLDFINSYHKVFDSAPETIDYMDTEESIELKERLKNEKLKSFPGTATPKKNPKVFAQAILDMNIFEAFEESYLNRQNACNFADDPEAIEELCSQLEDDYELVNDEINAIQDPESNDDEENLWPGSEEGLLGLQLYGEHITVNTAQSDDPLNKLHIESEGTRPNSILQKGHVVPKENEIISDKALNDAICFVQNYDILAGVTGQGEELLSLNLHLMKEALKRGDNDLPLMQKTYCTLYSYHEKREDFMEITHFLLLNMPEGENFCE